MAPGSLLADLDHALTFLDPSITCMQGRWRGHTQQRTACSDYSAAQLRGLK